MAGRTATDYIVVFNAPVSLAGEFAKVKITKTSPLTLFGEVKTIAAESTEDRKLKANSATDFAD